MATTGATMVSAVSQCRRARGAHRDAAEAADDDDNEKVEHLAGTAIKCVCPENKEDWTARHAGSLARRGLLKEWEISHQL